MRKLRLATDMAHSIPSGANTPNPGKPVGRLAEFHHQGVASFLEEVLGEVNVFAPLDDLVNVLKPALDMERLFGSLAIHESGIASRRTSSSGFDFRPPYDTRSMVRPRTCSMSCLERIKPNDAVSASASTSRSMSESWRASLLATEPKTASRVQPCSPASDPEGLGDLGLAHAGGGGGGGQDARLLATAHRVGCDATFSPRNASSRSALCPTYDGLPVLRFPRYCRCLRPMHRHLQAVKEKSNEASEYRERIVA